MKILVDNGHGINTAGKRSPDGRLREYRWARDIAATVVERLKGLGYDAELVVPEDADVSIGNRVARINAICDRIGARNAVLVSVHNNAAGSGAKWMDAHGWQVYVSKNASEASKMCAAIMTAEAEKYGLVNPKSRQKAGYWTWSWTKSDIGILARSKCPAVLTENMFQDNRGDVDYLLSERGREEIVALHVEAIKRYVAWREGE